MLRLIGQFFKDAGKLGVASEIGAVILYGLALWEHAKDRPLSAFFFVCASVPLFWLGAFLAWLKKHRELDASHERVAQLEKQLSDVPHLCVVPHGFYADIRPLGEQIGPVIRPIAQLSCLNAKFKNDPELSIESSIARNVLAELSFFDESDRLLCSLQGRWGETTQPPQLAPGQNAAQDLAMVDFGIGQERELNIAFKYQDENDCFGMSNDSYSYKDWKHPKQRLTSENIRVRVRLRGKYVDDCWDLWFHNPKGRCLQKLKFQKVVKK